MKISTHRLSVLATTMSAVGVLLLASCGGTAGDPKTADRSDLNAPGTIFTVTGSTSVQIRFPTGNFEKEFKGYYVFGTNSTLAAVTALVKYPATGVDITKAGIPRCKDNSAFFEAFGLAAATNDCKGAINAGDAASSTSTFADAGTPAAAPGFSTMMAAEDTAVKMTNYLECTEQAGAAVSLPVTTGSSKDLQKCTVAKVYDTSTKALIAAANGTPYVYMVLTVAGDKYNKISWSSNIVKDTPAPTAYSGSVTLSTDKYKLFTFNSAKDTATVTTTESSCPATNLCSLTGTNSQSTDGIYVARDVTSTVFQQRIFISTPADSAIRLLARGPQTYDPLDPAVTSPRTPADTAIAHTATGSSFAAVGSVLGVSNDHVFDFVMTSNTSTFNYGKIVFGAVTYASTTDRESLATIPITIVMQPLAGSTDYFTSH